MNHNTDNSADNFTADTNEFRQALRNDVFFLVDTIVMAVVGPFALALQIFFLVLLKRHFNIHHANVKLFMWTLSISLTCQSFYFIVNVIVNILYLTASAESFNFDMLSCQLIHVVASTASMADICSSFGMGIDRLYATVRRQFDDPTRSGILAKILVFGSWTITAATRVYVLATKGAVMKRTPMKHYCHVLLYSIDSKLSNAPAYALMAMQLLCICLPIVVLLINRRRYLQFGLTNSYSSRSHTLQQRFALSNNVAVSVMLLPLEIMRSLVYFEGLILLAYIKLNDLGWTARAASLCSLATFISIPFVCACPISCIYLDKRLRKAFLIYYRKWKTRCFHCHGEVTTTPVVQYQIPAVISSSEMEMKGIYSCSQSTAEGKASLRQASVVADCVIDYKTDPTNAQDIISRLWKRKQK